MRSSDASNLDDDDSCADLSETFVLQAADSDASLSPAHTTIVTVRRASAPAEVQQAQNLNEAVIIEGQPERSIGEIANRNVDY